MKYAKFAVAVVGITATVLMQMFAPETAVWQVANIVLAALTAAGVYAVPNRTQPVN